MSLTVQFYSLITMIGAGVYLGCMFDTLERFSCHWKDNRVLSYVIEISFWLLQTLCLFYILILVNEGEIKVYLLVAILIGFYTYQQLVAQRYRRFLEHVINVLRAVYQFCYRCVQVLFVMPFLWLIHLLMALVLFLFQLCVSVIKSVWRILSFIIRLALKPIWLVMPKNAKKYLVQLKGFYSKIKNIVINWIKTKWRSITNKKG